MLKKYLSPGALLIAAVVGALLIAGSAFAQHGGGGHGGGGHGGGGGGHSGGGFHGGGFQGGGFHGGFNNGFHGGFNNGFHGGFNNGFHNNFNHGFHNGFNRGFVGGWWYPYWGWGGYYYPYSGSYYPNYYDDYSYNPGSYTDDYPYRAIPPTTSLYTPSDTTLIPAPADQSARLTVKVPDRAEVWIDGLKTTSTGAVRNFASPPLAPGYKYSYEVRATWTANGREVTQTQSVSVAPGGSAEVDFPTQPTATTSASGTSR